MARNVLSKRSVEVYDWITRFQEREECSPSIDDISTAFGWASNNSVVKHLRSLALHGRVSFVTGKHRSLRFTEAARAGLIKKWSAPASTINELALCPPAPHAPALEPGRITPSQLEADWLLELQQSGAIAPSDLDNAG